MYGIKTCGIKSYLKVFEELDYIMELRKNKLYIGYDDKHMITIRKFKVPYENIPPHYQIFASINGVQFGFFGDEKNTIIHLARLLQFFIDDTYIKANLDTFILDIRNLVRYTYSFFKNTVEKLPLLEFNRDVRDSNTLLDFTTYDIKDDGLKINILSPHVTSHGFVLYRGTKLIDFDDTKMYESFLRFKYLFEKEGVDPRAPYTEELEKKFTLLQMLLIKEVFNYYY